MAYGCVKTNCPYELVQVKYGRNEYESGYALKYSTSLLFPRKGGEVKKY